ncbi:Uncharacterised protein [Chromobacterium violaceum]|uniref:Uncharacterized protein n=1 Tax=Chromobacterium violaceum TaxID=536 RepID=A0A3S4I4A0_CHRVL|nr:Uncharacterised protein [Chromobacterium violaceum]
MGALLGQFLKYSAALPLGVSGATTWLNLMTISPAAWANPERVRLAQTASAACFSFM